MACSIFGRAGTLVSESVWCRLVGSLGAAVCSLASGPLSYLLLSIVSLRGTTIKA